MYRYDKTHFTLDFPKGPLAVGDDTIMTWSTMKRGSEVLHVLSPTDCCRDRLASYLFWNDFSGLEQALGVAAAERIDLDVIEKWCKRERQSKKFALFAERLRSTD